VKTRTPAAAAAHAAVLWNAPTPASSCGSPTRRSRFTGRSLDDPAAGDGESGQYSIPARRVPRPRRVAGQHPRLIFPSADSAPLASRSGIASIDRFGHCERHTSTPCNGRNRSTGGRIRPHRRRRRGKATAHPPAPFAASVIDDRAHGRQTRSSPGCWSPPREWRGGNPGVPERQLHPARGGWVPPDATGTAPTIPAAVPSAVRPAGVSRFLRITSSPAPLAPPGRPLRRRPGTRPPQGRRPLGAGGPDMPRPSLPRRPGDGQGDDGPPGRAVPPRCVYSRCDRTRSARRPLPGRRRPRSRRGLVGHEPGPDRG
jgi:hypothetical protein